MNSLISEVFTNYYHLNQLGGFVDAQNKLVEMLEE